MDLVDEECSNFDLHEIGAIANVSTWVDAEWRRESRPKRIRPRSTDDKKLSKAFDKRRITMDAASFDTSSHHTVDYLLETRSAKSFTFGMASNTRYQHLK